MRKLILLTAIAAFFAAPYCISGPATAGIPPVIDLAATTKTVIVIDPAHGGGDWGVNFHGALEKDITLKIARYVKMKLDRNEKDVVTYLTRDSDAFMTAADRAGFANSKKAALFVSIHCDFSASEKSAGFKVYYQAGNQITSKRDESLPVPWESVQLYHVDDSARLAGYISQYMQAPLIPENASADSGAANDTAPLSYRKEAAVDHNSLTGVDMPAVVFEAGNLNNSGDFGVLKDDRMINRIAYHLKEGIVHYIREKEGVK